MSTTSTRTTTGRIPAQRRHTPDSHTFPTRSYDLVKEFVVALGVVTVLTVLLATVVSSPAARAITRAHGAATAPTDGGAPATSFGAVSAQ